MANNKDEQAFIHEARVILNDELGLEIRPDTAFSEWKKALTAGVDRLIRNDFHQLINLLYRLDVSETKLERLLKDNSSTDAAVLITNLIIERQVEKILTRQQFRDTREIDENEKW